MGKSFLTSSKHRFSHRVVGLSSSLVSFPSQQSLSDALTGKFSKVRASSVFSHEFLYCSILCRKLSIHLTFICFRFTAFYGGQHSGRKLNWLFHMSKGELVTNCFKNK